MENKYKNHFLYPLLKLFCSKLATEAQHTESDDKISGVQGHSWVHSELVQS